jgi:hypothetical protein
MFEAVLNKKLKVIENREDFITSCVFGAIKYDLSNNIIKSFLSKAIKVNRKKLNLPKFNKVNYHFWCKLKDSNETGEPDLILEFESDNETFFFILEIKNYSLKSGIDQDDQLKKYYLLRNSLNEFLDNKYGEITSKQIKGLIYLTRSISKKEVQESIDLIGKDYSDICPIYCLSWKDLIESCKEAKNQDTNIDLCDDIIYFLKYQNIIEFSGFGNIKLDINLNYNSFLFYNHIYFNNISNINTNKIKEGIFYEK